VRPIQALEHAERAADPHFLDQKRPLGIRGAFRRQAVGEVLGEPLEGHLRLLDRALLHVEDVIDGDSVDPRLELAAKVELRQPRDRANQDLLRGILGIFPVPQHAEGQAIDISLQISDELVEGIPIAVDGSSGDVFERHRLCSPDSINDFNVASSDRSVALCAFDEGMSRRSPPSMGPDRS